jgi:hypothetical protein
MTLTAGFHAPPKSDKSKESAHRMLRFVGHFLTAGESATHRRSSFAEVSNLDAAISYFSFSTFCRVRFLPVPYSFVEKAQTLVDNEESLKYNVFMAKVINRNLQLNS